MNKEEKVLFGIKDKFEGGVGCNSFGKRI